VVQGKVHDIGIFAGLIFFTLRGRPTNIVQNRLFWATGDEGWLGSSLVVRVAKVAIWWFIYILFGRFFNK